MNTRSFRGFTLLEIVAVLAIIGLIAAIAVPSITEMTETVRQQGEHKNLDNMAEEVKRSFGDISWDRNISALNGEIPSAAAGSITNFGMCSGYAQNGDWYVKIGRLRGVIPVIGSAVDESTQKSIWDVAYNGYLQKRWLVVGPSETGQQRYLLLSLMAPPTKNLVIPPNDGSTTWFDAIWNNEWDNKGATLPGHWTSALTAQQQAAWLSGRGTTTNVHYMIVQRIVQPKYTVTLNNTHPNYIGWLDYNGSTAMLTSPPGSGPSTTAEILAGRLIVCRRGIAAPGSEAYRIYLNENSSFNVTP